MREEQSPGANDHRSSRGQVQDCSKSRDKTHIHEVLDALPPESDKQRTVVLGDLAAVEAADGRPREACGYAIQALDQLAVTWYATGMDRVREVRRTLAPWQNEQCVRDLDDRLYDWGTTVSALQR